MSVKLCFKLQAIAEKMQKNLIICRTLYTTYAAVVDESLKEPSYI